jgi:hypothetical protein
VPINQMTCKVFHPQWWRTGLIGAIALTLIGVVGWRLPTALWVCVPMLGLTLVLAAFLHAGLILSRRGIEWYAIHPQWRFRKVPWHAVRDVRRGLFGFGGQIVLTVESGCYEVWVWGRPRRDREITIEIYPNALARGEEVWGSIQEWLARERRVSTVAAEQRDPI